MENTDLIKDINALMKAKSESESTQTPSPEDQITATVRARAKQPAETPAEVPTETPAEPAPKPKAPSAPAEDSPSSHNDDLLASLKNGTLSESVMKKMLLDFYGPSEKLEDGSDNPKRELYERAIRNGGEDLLLAAYAKITANLQLDKSSKKDSTDSVSFLLNSHPRGKEVYEASLQLEKADRLFFNNRDEEAFLVAEEALLSSDIKLHWYRLISLMGLMQRRYEKDVRKGIPGKLGEDVRKCAALPYVSAKQYRSGIFFSLLFTALMLFVLWCPPLRDFLVTNIQPDHLLHVCVVIIVILFFIASWGGAIAGVIVFGLLGAGIEHFFGEQALATTLIVLIYLVVELILFLLARSTGYRKVKQNKKHKKIKKQRAEMRSVLQPELRRRIAKLEEIEEAVKLDSDYTAEVLYWTAMTNYTEADALRQAFRDGMTLLTNLYKDAVHSL